jgi:endonuclease/exonuclease/phosphatase family metal-dependent hydrolase
MLVMLKKIARFCFIIANITVVIFYLLACLVPIIKGGSSWFIAMMGLIFPLLFFTLVGLLLYWMIRRSKWAVVFIIALLLGWKQVSVMIVFRLPKNFEQAKTATTLRVLTWNLSAWGQSNAADESKSNNQDQMMTLVNKTNADILCFQEYVYYKDKKVQDSILPAFRERGYQYSYFVPTKFNEHLYKTTRLITTIIISKYPIVDTSHLFYTDEQLIEPLIYADINVNGKKIRVFTTHLESVRFVRSDVNGLRNWKHPFNGTLGAIRLMAYKLRNAYEARDLQAATLSKMIKESPYPVIVCGDFNDVPNSYTYFTVKGNLQDAFLKKGTGFGRSLAMVPVTSLRIDYILADKKFNVTQCNVIEALYSDHYPIVADLNLVKDQ